MTIPLDLLKRFRLDGCVLGERCRGKRGTAPPGALPRRIAVRLGNGPNAFGILDPESGEVIGGAMSRTAAMAAALDIEHHENRIEVTR